MAINTNNMECLLEVKSAIEKLYVEMQAGAGDANAVAQRQRWWAHICNQVRYWHQQSVVGRVPAGVADDAFNNARVVPGQGGIEIVAPDGHNAAINNNAPLFIPRLAQIIEYMNQQQQLPDVNSLGRLHQLVQSMTNRVCISISNDVNSAIWMIDFFAQRIAHYYPSGPQGLVVGADLLQLVGMMCALDPQGNICPELIRRLQQEQRDNNGGDAGIASSRLHVIEAWRAAVAELAALREPLLRGELDQNHHNAIENICRSLHNVRGDLELLVFNMTMREQIADVLQGDENYRYVIENVLGPQSREVIHQQQQCAANVNRLNHLLVESERTTSIDNNNRNGDNNARQALRSGNTDKSGTSKGKVIGAIIAVVVILVLAVVILRMQHTGALQKFTGKIGDKCKNLFGGNKSKAKV